MSLYSQLIFHPPRPTQNIRAKLSYSPVSTVVSVSKPLAGSSNLTLRELSSQSVLKQRAKQRVFTSSFVHAMAKFPEQNESHVFEALADKRKADMSLR
jgi:hypothetical protein